MAINIATLIRQKATIWHVKLSQRIVIMHLKLPHLAQRWLSIAGISITYGENYNCLHLLTV